MNGRSLEKMIEYEVDSEGISLENFHLTGVEYDAEGNLRDVHE